MNASRINFDNCAQTFIACNAPKPNSFSHFWHMVIQEKVLLISLTLVIICLQVSLIVMITRLVEGQRIKANQYWPDSAEETQIGPELEVVTEIASSNSSPPIVGFSFSGGWRRQDPPSVHLLPRLLLLQVSREGLDDVDMSGSSQSLNLAARLGRFSSFTLKIGRTLGFLTARGEKTNLHFFRFESKT